MRRLVAEAHLRRDEARELSRGELEAALDSVSRDLERSTDRARQVLLQMDLSFLRRELASRPAETRSPCSHSSESGRPRATSWMSGLDGTRRALAPVGREHRRRGARGGACVPAGRGQEPRRAARLFRAADGRSGAKVAAVVVLRGWQLGCGNRRGGAGLGWQLLAARTAGSAACSSAQARREETAQEISRPAWFAPSAFASTVESESSDVLCQLFLVGARQERP